MLIVFAKYQLYFKEVRFNANLLIFYTWGFDVLQGDSWMNCVFFGTEIYIHTINSLTHEIPQQNLSEKKVG